MKLSFVVPASTSLLSSSFSTPALSWKQKRSLVTFFRDLPILLIGYCVEEARILILC